MSWEYLPWWLANVPVYGFYLWFAGRARHLFFFSNVNPAIPLAGAMGESKWDILQLLPQTHVPPMVFIPANTPVEAVAEKLADAGISFPLIAKPNVGERGFLIKKIENLDDLSAHLSRYPTDFILQQLLLEPMEASVLFHRFSDGRFGITSLCIKAFLTVKGNGTDSVGQLMLGNTRSALQYERFKNEFPEILSKVLPAGQALLLEPIGNHARGTKFLNGNPHINARLVETFRELCTQIEGVRYGRFDLKMDSLEALQRGEFQIMELNGILGEPAHIYDPEFGMWRAYRDLYRHWRIIYRLHRDQKQQQIQPTSIRAGIQIIRDYFKYKKEVENRNS